MEKLGVVIDPELSKEASEKKPPYHKCPKCGAQIALDPSDFVNKCVTCGTEPFEKKP